MDFRPLPPDLFGSAPLWRAYHGAFLPVDPVSPVRQGDASESLESTNRKGAVPLGEPSPQPLADVTDLETCGSKVFQHWISLRLLFFSFRARGSFARIGRRAAILTAVYTSQSTRVGQPRGQYIASVGRFFLIINGNLAVQWPRLAIGTSSSASLALTDISGGNMLPLPELLTEHFT